MRFHVHSTSKAYGFPLSSWNFIKIFGIFTEIPTVIARYALFPGWETCSPAIKPKSTSPTPCSFVFFAGLGRVSLSARITSVLYRLRKCGCAGIPNMVRFHYFRKRRIRSITENGISPSEDIAPPSLSGICYDVLFRRSRDRNFKSSAQPGYFVFPSHARDIVPLGVFAWVGVYQQPIYLPFLSVIIGGLWFVLL